MQHEYLVRIHCDYWSANPPDVSDKPKMNVDDLQFWTKQRRKSRLKPHTLNPGVCGVWLNQAYDYAMSLNLIPVRFKDADGVTVDLVLPFTSAVWVAYAACMVGYMYIVCLHTI